MTGTKTEAIDTSRELDRLAQPLARALGTIRLTLAGWGEAQIWNAIAILDRCSPPDRADPDLSEADAILRGALDHANAERLARSAPSLDVHISCVRGRWTLSAGHDQGDAMLGEFANFDEAKAAGETLHAFLALQGRAHEFSWESPHRTDRPRDFDTDIPF